MIQIVLADEIDIETLLSGLKSAAAKALGLHCVSIQREVVDNNGSDVTSHDDGLAFKFEPREHLERVKTKLEKHLPEEQVKRYRVTMTKQQDAQTSHESDDDISTDDVNAVMCYTAYLDTFVTDCVNLLRVTIKRNHEQWLIKHHHAHLLTELQDQAAFFLHESRSFGGRVRPMQQVEEYFRNAERSRCPLLISGASGSGKTSMMCAVAAKCHDGLVAPSYSSYVVLDSQKRVVTSRRPSSIFSGKFVHHTTWIRPLAATSEASTGCRVTSRVCSNRLPSTTRHASLLLSSLTASTASASVTAHSLFWLPRQLPRHVYLIVSSRTGDVINRMLTRPNQTVIELNGSADDGDVTLAVEAILKHESRCLIDEHRRVFLESCQSNRYPA